MAPLFSSNPFAEFYFLGFCEGFIPFRFVKGFTRDKQFSHKGSSFMRLNEMLSPKIVSQHVDTLKVGFIPANQESFRAKYPSLLERLERAKDNAQEIISFNDQSRYVKDDLGLGMGDWKVFARGVGSRYPYRIDKDEMTIMFSTREPDEDTPIVKVEFRASYLFAKGHREAARIVDRIVEKMIGPHRSLVSEIHLATDVWGVDYDGLDPMRFQTQFEGQTFGNAYKKNITFGSGDFMFRIYDKTKKIRQSPAESYIKRKWILNGWKSGIAPVYRHEVQYRRAFLKDFLPKGIESELIWIFENLGAFWSKAVNNVRFTPLTVDECIKIATASVSPESMRKIHQRARADESRFHFWDLLQLWDNDLCEQVLKVCDIKEAQFETVKRLVKGLVSSALKVSGGNPQILSKAVSETDKELREYGGTGLYGYGLNKVVDSIMDNARIFEKYGVVPTMDYLYTSRDAISVFGESLSTINDQKKFEKVTTQYERMKNAVA